MSKTRALFELTEERGKVHPRGVDYDLHQTTVQELSVTRSRLKEEVSVNDQILTFKQRRRQNIFAILEYSLKF